jgi:hypothetical protein
MDDPYLPPYPLIAAPHYQDSDKGELAILGGLGEIGGV